MSQQTYGRFMYDEVNDLFFLVPSVDSVWVWKNTLAGVRRPGGDGGNPLTRVARR